MFNPNQAFLFVQKLKSAPKDFTPGVKAEIEKKNSICPKLLINGELLWPCIGIKAENRIFATQPLGPMFQHLLISSR